MIERFGYTPYDCERCYYYIEDEEETCKNFYRELGCIADNVEKIRLKLFSNKIHKEWHNKDFEMVDSNLKKIELALRQLEEYL